MLKDRLLEARNAAGLSQPQLGALIGTSAGAIGLIETGKTKTLRATTALSLAKHLRVRPEWLVYGTGPMKSDAAELASLLSDLPDSARAEVLGYARYVRQREADPRKPATIPENARSE